MISNTIRLSRRALAALALALTFATLAPRPTSAADPVWGLLTALVRGVAPNGPAVDLDAAELDELEALKPGDAEIRRMLDAGVPVAQQAMQAVPVARPAYAPRYAMPAATGGYQTMQNTVNAAVTYWTGQRPQQVAPAATTYAQPAAAPVASFGDPYGFTGWLNGVRAQHGLAPVSYDSNLSAWANMNNAQQNSFGLGHHVMGPARRQNSAMGSAGSIGSQWLASPAHAAALLDPSIRAIGIAGMGAYWTFNAY